MLLATAAGGSHYSEPGATSEAERENSQPSYFPEDHQFPPSTSHPLASFDTQTLKAQVTTAFENLPKIENDSCCVSAEEPQAIAALKQHAPVINLIVQTLATHFAYEMQDGFSASSYP
ncbi:hypothetical protein [Parendozoicomonas sp. Alg238-R29]|uniref:hypothetical protein n=1 Tax=Parendozoicomonas sp. Alg238-R29 TaxID=2993446 RepID=UPI00248D6F61|nr:hypothetical protein [Parendozoicomonas sp. Alg238-R29]